MEPGTQTSPLPLDRLPNGELDLSGRRLDDFRVLRHLGQGGMGQVYLAEQISLSRKVALKILRPELAADPTALQRFKQEATAIARATHANIVQVHAIGEAEGVAYMALEYVEGRNLREYLAKKGPPDLLLALSIMRQSAAALQRASELGVVHRDIKPENILLTRKGEVKVADFGLARCLMGDRPDLHLTQSGVTMGTPLYMSPEQVEGKPVDGRSDIYSLGVTCYHMLAGEPPFQGNSPFEIALQHVQAEPKPLPELRPDLPPALADIIRKMMAKAPPQRYQTGRELIKDIARLREGLSGQTAVVTPMIGAAQPVASLRHRRRWLVVGLSLLLAAAFGVGIGWLRHRRTVPVQDVVAPSPEKEEENALRTIVEPYLVSRPADAVEAQTGLGLCMKLGIFYLEHDRLEDALALFTRLNTHPRPAYRMLGHLGRAIVSALRNECKESNELFRDVFVHGNYRPNSKQHFDGMQRWMWQEEKWRYWMRKALHYNQQNGIKREDVPAPLRNKML